MSAQEQRWYATGRRKRAVARVWLMPGTGKMGRGRAQPGLSLDQHSQTHPRPHQTCKQPRRAHCGVLEPRWGRTGQVYWRVEVSVRAYLGPTGRFRVKHVPVT